ncbi:MAG: DUF3052 domain-containing protein [Solirubrobacteraceae bacterium]
METSAGYSKTPLWKKLGVHVGDSLLLIDAPPGWGVPDLPDGVTTALETGERATTATAEVVIAFFPTLASLRERVPALATRIFPAGALWVAWPRRAGGHESDIRDQDIRDVALPLGLVDVKVAALDEDWSGLRLVWRRELRHTSRAPSG